MGKVLEIIKVGDPVLSAKCENIDISNINNEILEDIENLKATLNYSEGFGIAAPQVGIRKRIIVIKVEKDKCSYDDCDDLPITAMINPTWKRLSQKTDIQYEGCLSVTEIRGKVERYKEIELTYYDEKGNKIIKNVKGFFARLIQHECDHLDGIVFLERVKEHGGFATLENIKKYNLRKN